MLVHDCWVLAADKEVEKALIKEAKRRDFKKGVRVKSLTKRTYKIENNKFEFIKGHNKLYINNILLFENGKWAEIIQTITKEEAEKELGKTIVG